MGVRRLGATVVSGGGLDSKARLRQIDQYRPDVMLATPTYALYLGETAREIGMDLARTSISHVIVAGEPGGSIPATRQAIEDLWGARCYELYGIAELGPTNPGCPLREVSTCARSGTTPSSWTSRGARCRTATWASTS